MKNIYRPKELVLLLVLLLLLPVSCSSVSNKSHLPYNTETELPLLKSGAAASNGRFSLYWDDSYKVVLLYDKEKKVSWSSLPYEYYMNLQDSVDSDLASSLVISYIEPMLKQRKTMGSYTGAIENGRVSCEKIEGGIEVIYYFDQLEISVPVQFLVTEHGMEARVIIERIVDGENMLYNVSLLPFLASVKGNTADSYLFVPSGSGALMYTDEGKRQMRVYSEETYGDEPARLRREKVFNTESVRLPVFGAKAGDNALLGIVNNGAHASRISAQAGGSGFGYSQVNASFLVRGEDTVEIPDPSKAMTETEKYTSQMIDLEYVSVLYHPLYGEDATYTGMAKEYARFLSEEEKLKDAQEEPPLYLEFLGGAYSVQQILGIPYEKLITTTTFANVKTVLNEIISETGTKPAVKLAGFGESGLDVGKVAGNYKLNKQMGGIKGYNALNSYCRSEEIKLFTDFDLVNFRKSGNGFSTRSGAAYSAGNVVATQYQYDFTTIGVNSSAYTYLLLERGSLIRAAEKLMKKSKDWKLSGVSLSSLSSTAYSDYSERQFFSKGAIEEDVAEIFDEFQNQGHPVLAENPNVYSAVKADYILAAPTFSSGYNTLDKDIPFYQIVFKGRVPISVPQINLSGAPDTQYLKAIETGSALSFTLSYTFDYKLTKSAYNAFSFSLYRDEKERITALMADAKDYLEKVNGAKITEHHSVSEGVTETVFDNGVRAFVNYTDSEAEIPNGPVVNPRGFAYTTE